MESCHNRQLSFFIKILREVKTMADTTKNIKIDAEKVKAIKLYAGDYDIDKVVQTAVDDAINKLYVKVVPKPVREYIEGTVQPKNIKPAKDGDES